MFGVAGLSSKTKVRNDPLIVRPQVESRDRIRTNKEHCQYVFVAGPRRAARDIGS